MIRFYVLLHHSKTPVSFKQIVFLIQQTQKLG